MSEDEPETDPAGGEAAGFIDGLLKQHGFPLPKIPANREGWFTAFLQRTSQRFGNHGETGQDDEQERFRFEIREMLSIGVVTYIANMIRAARNPDGDEARRGYAYSAQLTLGYFCTEEIKEILEDAALTTDEATWLRYPLWFGTDKYSHPSKQERQRLRQIAVRWLPAYTLQNVVDLSFLEDTDPLIRRYTAMNVAQYSSAIAARNKRVIDELINAVNDRHWVWSLEQDYAYGWRGAHSAAETLATLGLATALGVAWPIQRLILLEEQTLVVPSKAISDYPRFVQTRLDRLKWAIDHA
jgi:hypothetical protein